MEVLLRCWPRGYRWRPAERCQQIYARAAAAGCRPAAGRWQLREAVECMLLGAERMTQTAAQVPDIEFEPQVALLLLAAETGHELVLPGTEDGGVPYDVDAGHEVVPPDAAACCGQPQVPLSVRLLQVCISLSFRQIVCAYTSQTFYTSLRGRIPLS
eukprot:189264-Chlamydomonas_euryale.AAC.3